MKRLLSLLLAIAMTLSLTQVVLAEGDAYSLYDAIKGDTEQGGEWFYLGKLNDGDWQELHYTPNWGDNWQISDNPEGDDIYFSLYLSEEKLVAFTGARDDVTCAIAAKFVAPKDGTLFIAPWRPVFSNYDNIWVSEEEITVKPNTDGSVTAYIQKNGEQLASGESGALQVEVATGDEIWFIIEPDAGSEGDVIINDIAVSYDEALLPVQRPMTLLSDISYGGDGVYSLHDAFTGDSEQGPEWYYVKRYNKGAWEELNYYPEWGDNWQVSKNPNEDAVYFSLFDWNGVSTQTGYDILEEQPYEVAAAFKAPQDGNLVIAPWRHVMYVSNDSLAGVISYEPYTATDYAAAVYKNDELLYFKRLSGGLQTAPEMTVAVNAGDMIYFVFSPLEMQELEGDSASLRLDDIRVGYEGVSFSELPEIIAQDLPEPPAQSDDPVPGEAPAEEAIVEATLQEEPAQTETPTEALSATPAPTPAPTNNNGWVTPVIIVIAVIVAAAVVFVVLKKKQK